MKKFDKIVIASDLDGTFFGTGARLVQRNLDAVKYFTENGGHFAIASGRSPAHIRMPFPSIAEYVNMPCATSNGAVISDFCADTKRIVKQMDRELVLEFNSFVRGVSDIAAIRFSSETVDYVYTPEDAVSPYYEKELGVIKEIGASCRISEPCEWDDLRIYQAVIKSEKEDIVVIREALKEHFDGRLYVTQSGRSMLDIQCHGVTKGNTLRSIANEVVGEGYTLYTCGDYLNDLGLHASADVAVCPENAHEDIKAICSLCFCSNEEGVIADLIEYLDKELEE